MTAPAARSTGSRLAAYARLAKLDFPDFYLSVPLAMTLVHPSARFDSATLRVALLCLLGEVTIIGALVALDDVQGEADGSDRANYGGSGPLRKQARKPLLHGTLDPRSAKRFALVTGLIGLMLCVAVVLVAPYRPLIVTAVLPVIVFAGFQYSWGAKLSYHGFQEFLIAFGGAYLVTATYGFMAGRPSARVLIQAALFGLWMLEVSAYSNINDREGDALVGRRNVAVVTGATGSSVFIGCLALLEAALVGAAFVAVGPALGWVLVPILILRAFQFHVGIARGDALRARRLGVWIHRAGVGLLIIANLLST